jgi:hypothetical protein
MRRTHVALSTVAALIAGSLLFGSNRADTMISAAPLGHAGQSISPVEKPPAGGWGGAAGACLRADIITALTLITLAVTGMAILTVGSAAIHTRG